MEPAANSDDDNAFRDARNLEDAGSHEKAYEAYREYLARFPGGSHAKDVEQRGKRIAAMIQARARENQALEAFQRGMAYRDQYPTDYAGARKYFDEIIQAYRGTRAATDAQAQLDLLERYEKGEQKTKTLEQADQAIAAANALLAKGAFEPARQRFEEIAKVHASGTKWNRLAQEGLQKAREGAERLYGQFESPVKQFLLRDNPTMLDLIQARGILTNGIPLLQAQAGAPFADKARERLKDVEERIATKFQKDFASALRSALAANHPDALDRLKRLDQEFKSVANFGAILLDARSRLLRLQALHKEVLARFQRQGPKPYEGILLGAPSGRITGADDLGVELTPSGGAAVRVPWRLVPATETERLYGVLVPPSEAAWADAFDALRWIRTEAEKTK